MTEKRKEDRIIWVPQSKYEALAVVLDAYITQTLFLPLGDIECVGWEGKQPPALN